LPQALTYSYGVVDMVGWPTGHRGIRLQADPRKNEVGGGVLTRRRHSRKHAL